MRKFLIPVDHSEYSKRAIEEAKKQAKAFDGNVVVLNYVSADTIMESDNIQDKRSSLLDIKNWEAKVTGAEEKSYRLLEKYKAEFKELGIGIETVMLHGREKDISKTICQYADENDVDMIIIGSRGVGAHKLRLYMGSVAIRVIHASLIPVLVVQ